MIIVVTAVFNENNKYSQVFLDECLYDHRHKCGCKSLVVQQRNKNIICETKSFYILLTFLLITIKLLIAISIYYYLIKDKAKQKHLLPFYVTNNKLKKKFCINDIL